MFRHIRFVPNSQCSVDGLIGTFRTPINITDIFDTFVGKAIPL